MKNWVVDSCNNAADSGHSPGDPVVRDDDSTIWAIPHGVNVPQF